MIPSKEAIAREAVARGYRRGIINLNTESDFHSILRFAIDKATEEISKRHDLLVERSVGAMAIAEGDEGWQKITVDCPMLDAVKKLRLDRDEWQESSNKAWREGYEIGSQAISRAAQPQEWTPETVRGLWRKCFEIPITADSPDPQWKAFFKSVAASHNATLKP